MNPIEELSPKGVWKNFYALTQIPRPSGHTEQVAVGTYGAGCKVSGGLWQAAWC